VATILIVDDHEVVRRGIRSILGARPEWEVIGEASNGRDAAPFIVNLGCRVLVFTMHESKEVIAAIRATGAHGFVQKMQAGGQLIEAIDMCLSGGAFVVSPDLPHTQ
jgi:DNA-binding NarL/FixJ family response regulator